MKSLKQASEGVPPSVFVGNGAFLESSAETVNKKALKRYESLGFFKSDRRHGDGLVFVL
jgi:hypothetical protein